MYVIVEFLETGEVEAVPDTWIQENSVLWPPHSSGTIKNLIKNHGAPKECWITYEIRKLTTASDYDKARQKLRMAEYTSDLQSEEDNSTQKRKKRPTLRYISETDSDLEVSPPLKKKAMGRSFLPLPPPPPMQQQSVSVVPEETTQQARQRDTCSAVQRQILRMLEEMREDVAHNARTLNTILKATSRGQEQLEGATLPEGVTFPLQTMEELEHLEVLLEDSSVEKSMIAYLHITGREQSSEIGRRVLPKSHYLVSLATAFIAREGKHREAQAF
ncbi:PREDICTED: uncharacterized protein LOC106812455 [Priapulus caudatus]|uniref:Uncharacterized protein LOC106812455 n=1 Tax=Priapulus caudatus TaxID=37621 RepID=A0ABM1EI04_PRICU|nr:PREDICTED: uncharacterized protein LOC106812455 [Priapulus caudatus]